MKKIKISIFYPIVVIIFLMASIGLMKYRTDHVKLVTITDDQNDYFLQTYSQTVEDVLNDCEIVLGDHDVITPSVETVIENNMVISIERSFSLIIYDGNEAINVNTTKHTVREILDEQNIQLESLDIVAPFIDAKISDGTHISVTRVWDEIESEQYLVPYLTEINLVESLDDTEVELLQKGQAGMTEVKYRLRYENGEMVSRTFTSEVVLIEPINEIKNKGTDNLFVTSRGMPFRYSKVIIAEATAYDLSYASCGKYPGDPAYGITYSGTQARPGVIAVDPRVIPLKSNVYIESLDRTADYGFAKAEDTGSAIKGNRVDLFIGDNAAALRYGRRNVRVYIIEDEVDEELIKGYGY